MPMRDVLRPVAWLALGVGVALLALELGLRLMPVSMGLYRTQQYERWPLQSYEPGKPYTYSHTWALRNAHRGTTNNYGHIAPFDFRKNAGPVIVMGDSFVEALMNDYGDTLQGRLGSRLGAIDRVYGLGVSGLSISEYLAQSRLARGEFGPTAAVIMISDGDLTQSTVPGVGHYHFAFERGSVALRYNPLYGETVVKTIRRHIGEVSLYRYLEANLGFSLDRFSRWVRFQPSPPAEPAAREPSSLRPVVDYFLDQLAPALGVAPRCVVFLLDSDRYAIYKPELATKRIDAPDLRSYFVEQARARGFHAVDLDPVFRKAYADQRLKFDYWPIDRHWNALGHDLAADQAYRALFDGDAPNCRRRSTAATP